MKAIRLAISALGNFFKPTKPKPAESDFPRCIISQKEFDDFPVAATEAEARTNGLPTRFLMLVDQLDSEPAKEIWGLVNQEGADCFILEVDPELQPPQTEADKTELAEMEKTIRAMSIPDLRKWLTYWKGQRRIVFKRIKNETGDSHRARQADHDKSCDDAIAAFSEVIRLRLKPENAIRSALPKKKQREIGLLPKINA